MNLHVSDDVYEGGDKRDCPPDHQQATDLMYWRLEASNNLTLTLESLCNSDSPILHDVFTNDSNGGSRPWS